ncbi:hypothetical protein GYA93_24170 [Gordonia desulfuricans]|uniref:Uncharacterized protein n=1 Tax=Gordonia desulfuricans TaxID=89051 RepID=A0A7K3LWW4_9ACTN|nr:MULTISPECIES: hypothetical protein [Gordonia]EMP10415.1 hypothetical protein ISGA_4928 [Gordonia sp. NB41Y]NDK92616.1 hypothetical protein [Gordonia desulfuricans]WLP89829.1 hypothetical protein Q9K23_20125 [Gordonia sp. NB41Y]
MRPALATVSPHRTHRFALPRRRLLPAKSRRHAHPPYTPPWEKRQRWDPLDALLAALLATIGFAVTVLLILTGSTPAAVLTAIAIAFGSTALEIYILHRLP